MRAKFTTIFTVFGAAAVLMLAGNGIALAATGHGFVLGKSNSANKVTTLSRTTAGSVLSLHSKSSASAPLTVNGTGKVANLNADRLDGLDSSALRTNAYVFTRTVTTASTGIEMSVPLPPGTYLIGYSAYMLGGGSAGGAAGCYIERDAPTETPEFTDLGETRIVTSTSTSPSVSGNGIVSIGPGATVAVICNAPTAFTTDSSEPIQVTATRVDVVGRTSSRVTSSTHGSH